MTISSIESLGQRTRPAFSAHPAQTSNAALDHLDGLRRGLLTSVGSMLHVGVPNIAHRSPKHSLLSTYTRKKLDIERANFFAKL